MTNDERAEKVVADFVAESEKMKSLCIGNIEPFIVAALDEKDEEIERLKTGNEKLREQKYCSMCGMLFDEYNRLHRG